MLEHLGQQEAAGIVMAAVRLVAKEGPRTRDLGGTAITTDVERALVAALGK